MIETPSPDWTLMIHGGSGRIERGHLSAEGDAAARGGLRDAIAAGAAVLARGGGAVDAVQAAVEVLEDHPHFNAGHGAALARDGRIELDAAIMDGHTRAAGSVAGVTRVRRPVALARAVMDDARHVLLGGEGAEAFARELGVEMVDPAWFETAERRRQLEQLLARNADAYDVDMKYGTVGAVARDAHGHVAAATSTGGVTGKRPGRIGDSPVIGAGTYADDRGCAVSATGAGEFFLRGTAAAEVSARMRLAGLGLDAAVAAVLADVRALGGVGGLIAAASDGSLAWGFTTPGMYRARLTAGGEPVIAMYGDEA